ncbi:DUF4134 domain-containing protein [Galbibacter sp. EGI 63066]|uniref:DUF4134 domain-containing protein n=1 Tax=Galbibacter sp. EGI 63066 TaxID=2993559 RepID=UPI00224910CD|nr:DUF4134 domain-containing protein [Galbibacter sp. EGI 63066]MCX2680983.1 DUF4134 domain-containing protein [Galbibacter sp. EGI 63066]
MKTKRNYPIQKGALVLLLLLSALAYAQDGNAGIVDATNRIKGYFATGTNLMYAIGALVGLIGAIKVYNKWNSGDHDTGKVAAAWFGSCIFLVLVATVIKSFFGV